MFFINKFQIFTAPSASLNLQSLKGFRISKMCISFLWFPYLQNLGDIALAALGEGCHVLKDIVISHCPQITDAGLAHLVRGCTQLETIQMVYCPSITSAGVATVISSCNHMKKVQIEKWKVSNRTMRRSAAVLSFLCVEL